MACLFSTGGTGTTPAGRGGSGEGDEPDAGAGPDVGESRGSNRWQRSGA
jgi:hypothetical protein